MNNLEDSVRELEKFAIRSLIAGALALFALIAWLGIFLGQWLAR